MKKVAVAAGVEIDCCDAHGVWLDNNELQAIVAHAEQSTSSGAGSTVSELAHTVMSSAASGAGFSVGSNLASALIRRVFG